MNTPVAPRNPASLLQSERLQLEASHPLLAPAICDFHQRNLAHLAPWEPPRSADFLEPVATEARMNAEVSAFAHGQMWRYWLTRHGEPTEVIGQCQVSQVARGVAQNAWLGYSLDAAQQGQGYMQEALHCLLDELFSPRVWLHRIQVAVRPDNAPSLRVMERMGFREEGLCRDYLFIAGAWRDHKIFALTNPAWDRTEPPLI
ncbi:GNAT family N-acetyltransferase [Roseateles sp. SL47]|uniref:GNAT family N-acetyltransferase n=1 Tax=Roseateles sp. SL47 TaxID=2995138 RepID=UPI00226F08FF|nr:GNAT family N-acetyltransferase [Roseateles sp. SL47]WAC75254.1 GNAT family N-acetyltransferase [Roseateles sp. SL47]